MDLHQHTLELCRRHISQKLQRHPAPWPSNASKRVFKHSVYLVTVSYMPSTSAQLKWAGSVFLSRQLARESCGAKVLAAYVEERVFGVVILMQLTPVWMETNAQDSDDRLNFWRRTQYSLVPHSCLNQTRVLQVCAFEHRDQVQVVRLLEKIIRRGYILNMCDINSFGVCAATSSSTHLPVLWDVSGLRKHSKVSKRWALAYALFCLLRHCPKHAARRTVLFSTAMACVMDTRPWFQQAEKKNRKQQQEWTNTQHPELQQFDLVDNRAAAQFLRRCTFEAVREEAELPELRVCSLVWAAILLNSHTPSILTTMLPALRRKCEQC